MSITANSFCLVYVTTSSEMEATKIASTVISDRLAACANILGPVKSMYWWDGSVQTDQECSMLLKTRKDLFSRLEQKIRTLHSYDCPCIVALPLENGNASFLQWLSDQTLGGDEAETALGN